MADKIMESPKQCWPPFGMLMLEVQTPEMVVAQRLGNPVEIALHLLFVILLVLLANKI
jgi:hypothetical protein